MNGAPLFFSLGGTTWQALRAGSSCPNVEGLSSNAAPGHTEWERAELPPGCRSINRIIWVSHEQFVPVMRCFNLTSCSLFHPL